MPAAYTSSPLELPSTIPSRLHLCVAILLLTCPQSFGQILVFPGNSRTQENAEEQHARRLPSDPQLQSQYLQGLQLLNNGETANGLQLMQSIIDSGNDYFVTNGSDIQGNVRSEIDAAILKHRAEYERLFGTAAKDELARATDLQDDESLLELCRTHGLTDAGAVALEQLARRRQQQGDWISAARSLDRLMNHPAIATRKAEIAFAAIHCWLAADLPTMATQRFTENREALTQLASQKNWPAPDQLSCSEWIARISPKSAGAKNTPATHHSQWPVPTGHISQTGWTSSAPILTEPTWTYPLVDDYDQLPEEMTRLAREMVTTTERQMRSQADRITLPAGRPLLVGTSVITSGYGVVRAMDRKTGELRWPGVVVDETFDFLFRSSYSPDHPQNADAMRSEMLEMFVAMRGWRDLTSASISTDGKLVYAISGCHLPSTLPANMLLYNPARDPRLPQKDNQLHAYDLRTGNLIWTMMGDVPISEFALEPGEEPPRHPVFFYGAPVPVNGRLFCIGEERGQIQLLELNPDARVEGEILWAVGLLNPDRDLLLDDRRRLAGMMPTYAGGLMICPTGEGTVVAVDIDRREVVWSHQYVAAEAQTREQLLRMRGLQLRNANSPRQTANNLLDQERWFDARMLVAGGKVVLTPPDSDDLVCLDLLTGEPVWTRSVGRHSTVYLGGTYRNALIVVGQTDLELLSLDDGSRVWGHPLALAAPSGRGLRMEFRFLQPLVTGEIAVVDLDAARVLCRVPLGNNRIAGNLAAAEGQIVFQSGSEVVAFDPLDAVEKHLAQLQSTDPDSVEALALDGELKLQQGQLEDGIVQLQQALRRSGDERLKRMLSWTLLEGLRTDFPTYERFVKDLAAYVSADQRTLYLTTLAEGLRKHGREGEALDTYLALLGEYTPTVRLDRQNSQWQCRYDRLIGGRLQQLNSSPDVQSRITRFLQNLPPDQPSQLLTTLELLGPENLPPAGLVNRLEQLQVKDGDALRRESLALQLQASDNPPTQAQGLALLALIALQHHDGIAAQRYLKLLENLPPETRLPSGQTGAERATQLRADPGFQEVLAAAPEWPRHVHVDPDHRMSVAQHTMLPVFGAASEELSGWTFSIDATGININVFDADGRLRGREGTGLTNNRAPVGPRFGRYVQMRGHLASVVCQDRVLLLDLLTQQGTPRLIANISLFSPDQHPGGARNVVLNHTNRDGLRGPGSRTFTISGSWAGNAGPLLAGTFCHTVGSDLVAIDPTTGLELWRHSGIPVGAEIIGDDHAMTVVSQEEKRLMIFRTLNGELLREGPIPDHMLTDWQGVDWKGLLPTLTPADSGLQLAAYDPVTDEIRWSHLIPEHAIRTELAGRRLGYLTPEGQFRVLDVASGQRLWETRLTLKGVPKTLRALTYGDDWLLATNSTLPVEQNEDAVPSKDASTSGLRELFMLNSKTGKLQWQREFPETGDFTIPALPGRWPLVVAYLSQESEQPPRNGFPRGMRIQAMEAHVLDRWTGNTVWRAEGVDTGNFVGWSGETQPFRMHIKYGSLTLSLKCLDTPPVETTASETPAIPPPPAQQESRPSGK